MVDTPRSKAYLEASVFDTRGFSHVSTQNMRDLIESVYPTSLRASVYIAAQANTAAGHTLALQNAINDLFASVLYTELICDWYGLLTINDELLFSGSGIQNKNIRGLYGSANSNTLCTTIQQTDSTKGILIYSTNVTGNAVGIARCAITDLKLTYATPCTRQQTRAFAIGFQNTPQTSANAFLFFTMDRLYIESAYVGIGLRSNATTWQPSMTVVLNQLIAPSPTSGYDNGNSHYYKITTIGGGNTGAVAEPTWPTGASSTVVSNGITYTEQGSIQYFPLWGTYIAPTFVEIHDCSSQAIKWSNGYGVGQPENVIGNLYLQNYSYSPVASGGGGGTESVEPAIDLENVEVSVLSLGIEDWTNRLMRTNGDEQIMINLLHVERVSFVVANNSLFQFKNNSISVKGMRAYNIYGNSVVGQVFEFRGNAGGILEVGAMISNTWNLGTNIVLMKGTPDSWRISHHGVGGNTVTLATDSSIDALDEYNGTHAGGTTRLVPTGSSAITVVREVAACTPTGNVTGITINNGSFPGQILTVLNNSAFTITFNTVDATAHIEGASGTLVIPAKGSWTFRWNSSSSRWVHQV